MKKYSSYFGELIRVWCLQDANRLSPISPDWLLISTKGTSSDFVTSLRIFKWSIDTDLKAQLIEISVIAEWVVLKCGINDFHKFKPDTAIKHSKPETDYSIEAKISG